MEIIVTGASSHLGKALVGIGLARGHRMIAVSRRSLALSTTANSNLLVLRFNKTFTI